MASVRRLEFFVAVVRHQGVAESSRRLHVAPSAISMELRRLEAEAGLPLFDRRSSRWTLTPSGEALYRHAVEVLMAMERVDHTLAGFSTGLAGELILGASTSVGESLLLEPLTLFQHRHLAVRVRVLVGNSGQVAEWLGQGTIELAVMGEPTRNATLWCRPFHRDQIWVIAPPSHPLASLSRVDPGLLNQYPWVTRENGSATRARAEACLATLGIDVSYRLELGSNEAVKQAVIHGLGLAGLSEHVLRPELDRGELVTLPVTGWDCARWFCLAQRKDSPLGPLAQGFWDIVWGWNPSP